MPSGIVARVGRAFCLIWLAFLGVCLSCEAIASAGSDAGELCDRLASDPFDPAREAQGVAFDDIEPDSAVQACLAAAVQNPDNDRYRFQLSRALDAGGRTKEAGWLLHGAAKHGYPIAQAHLGAFELAGGRIGKRVPRPEYWLNQAAENDVPMAQLILARAYLSGMFGEGNEQKGLHWLSVVEKKGMESAKVTRLEFEILGAVKRDDADVATKARHRLKLLAEAGNVDAALSLARLYSSGIGVARNWTKAMDWYERAARAGNTEAQRKLAFAYKEGLGRERDEEKAAKWQKAASKERKSLTYGPDGFQFFEGR
ncbi:MAG: hypothetical protein CMI59_06315 [Parvibaculum sp.]|nr:hypothetical protein [Parvibaculum sp.]